MGIKKGVFGGVPSSTTHKEACRLATAAALPAYSRTDNVITASSNGQLADIDGITPQVNDSILLRSGASSSDNGIYKVTVLGDAESPFVLTRRDDADEASKIASGMRVPIGPEGSENANKVLTLITPNPITLNTSSLVFVDVLSTSINNGTPYIPTGLIRIAGTGDANSPLNNWSPSQFSVENYYRITSDGGPVTITGFDSSLSVGPKTFTWNTNAVLTIAHDDVGSDAGNRVLCPEGTDLLVPQYGSFTIATPSFGSNWQILSTSF